MQGTYLRGKILVKLNIGNILLISATIVIIWLVWRGCNLRTNISNYKTQVENLKLENNKYKQEVNNKNERIAEQKQIMLEQKDAIRLGLIEIKDLKRVKSRVGVGIRTTIDSVEVKFSTDTQRITDTVLVGVPKRFTQTEDSGWYDIRGRIEKSSIVFDYLSFKNRLEVTVGDKRQKGLFNRLFKRPKPIVRVKSYNPYTDVTGLDNIIIKQEPKKFYQTRGFWFIVGALTGSGGIIYLTK